MLSTQNVQDVVVESRLKRGYTLIGTARSPVSSGYVKILTKGKHSLAINSFGYDEYFIGCTYFILDERKS
jgi:hypothetical protein